MSKLSFISFCINYYAEHKGKPANEIYALFQKTGLLQLIRDDYDDLHGMGMEYMMQFCDKYLGQNAKETLTTHATVRTILLPEILQLIGEKYHLSEEDAMDKFFKSQTGNAFCDDETGLYSASALYVYGLFVEEMEFFQAA